MLNKRPKLFNFIFGFVVALVAVLSFMKSFAQPITPWTFTGLDKANAYTNLVDIAFVWSAVFLLFSAVVTFTITRYTEKFGLERCAYAIGIWPARLTQVLWWIVSIFAIGAIAIHAFEGNLRALTDLVLLGPVVPIAIRQCLIDVGILTFEFPE